MEDLDYVHLLDGRLRVKVPKAKRSPSKARQIEKFLRRMRGVTEVKANTLTGNVLVLFRSAQIDASRIVAALRELECFTPPPQQSSPGPLSYRLSNVLVQSVAQTVVERAILAFL